MNGMPAYLVQIGCEGNEPTSFTELGLPSDVRVLGRQYMPQNHAWLIALTHPSFPPRERGSQIPLWNPNAHEYKLNPDPSNADA